MVYIQQHMIANIKKKGISSGSVLQIMAAVPRHLFISEALRYRAYDDAPLPIGYGQTISKPSVIARMVQALELTGDERVLEIGTGSGYQAAILSQLARNVVTLERIEALYIRARSVLFTLNFANVKCVHSCDFNQAEGNFDAVIVAAGADIVPTALFNKISVGGRLVIPIGGPSGHRIKKYIKKDVTNIIEEDIGEATFVPYVFSETA